MLLHPDKTKINEIIKQIQTEQEALKNATTIEEKRAILGTIETLGLDISSLMADISSYQETLENATSVVEAAFTNIETAKGNAVQKQQDGQLKIIENTQEAAEATSSTVATQAEGVKNILNYWIKLLDLTTFTHQKSMRF